MASWPPKFVRDDPPRALVDELAQVYLDNDTAIAPVLRALVASKAFAGAVGSKVRDPGEDLVASYRALDVKVLRPASEESAANALLSQVSRIGTVPFGWPRPTDSRSTTTRGPPRHGCWRRCTRTVR